MSFLTFKALKQVLNLVENNSKLGDDTDYKELKKLGINYNAASKGGKPIVDLTRSLLVEPTFVFSNSLKNLDTTTDLAKVLVNIFSGYYAQAFSYLTNIDSIRPRTAFRLLASSSLESDNSVYKGLNLDLLDDESKLITLPIDKPELVKSIETVSLEAGKNGLGLDDRVNLVLGREITINLSNKDTKTTVPVIIRAGIKYINIDVISQLTNLRGRSKQFIARLDSWRAGGISFLKDFLFASDLIKEYKQARLTKDKEHVLEDVTDRANKAVLQYLNKKGVGFGGLYSAIAITKEEAIQLESSLGGKLSKFSIRENIFESSLSLFLVVVDTDFERVVFYTRGLKNYTDLSLKDLKSVGNKDTDLTEIFKSFSAGIPPTL